VNERSGVLLDGSKELVDQVVHPLLGCFVGDLSVKPVSQLVVSDNVDTIGVGVFDLDITDFNCFLVVEVILT
jgi:large-conductance mechanosensitive channel